MQIGKIESPRSNSRGRHHPRAAGRTTPRGARPTGRAPWVTSTLTPAWRSGREAWWSPSRRCRASPRAPCSSPSRCGRPSRWAPSSSSYPGRRSRTCTRSSPVRCRFVATKSQSCTWIELRTPVESSSRGTGRTRAISPPMTQPASSKRSKRTNPEPKTSRLALSPSPPR